MIDVKMIHWEKVNGLLPVIVQSQKTKKVLMLGYMDKQALKVTLEERKVCFYSRTKKCLWRKGETSGNFLEVKEMFLDCDQDALLVIADPLGPTCHKGFDSCFSYETEEQNFLQFLEKMIDGRKKGNDKTSYVLRLTQQGKDRVAQKVGEEGVEVAIASVRGDQEKIKQESADLLFHVLVNLREHCLSLDDVVDVLKQRNKGN